MLKKGDKFPEFSLENQNGELVSNETIKGQTTILYFYPRDNTPTCTTEACDFRDNIELFNDLNVNIYGVSGDSKKKHQILQKFCMIEEKVLIFAQEPLRKKFHSYEHSKH